MQCWLLNPERFVKLNGFDQVTDPISFDKGMIPSQGGLFSTNIFGMSLDDRRNKFAYIDLKRKFITPKAFISLKQLNRNFESLIYGTKKFRIENGLLISDEENGQTGMDFLYKNWDNIKFEKNSSDKRNERIDLLKNNKKSDIFIEKFIVIPAFYRDANVQQASSSTPRVPEINDKYNQIIRNVNLITASNNFDMLINALIGKTQQLIVDVYNILKSKVEKKNGYLRKFVMGKSVDYCSRVTITAADYSSETWQDQHIDFEHTGLPLSFCLSMMTPFIIWWATGYFKRQFENNKDNYPVILKDGSKVYVKLESPELVYNTEYLERRLDRYINNPSSRFDKIELPIRKDYIEKYAINYPIYVSLVGYNTAETTMQKDHNRLTRPLTWTDIFYMAADDVSSDKFCQITRYPLLDYLGTFFTKITVLSTRNTMPMVINNHLYPEYPVVHTDSRITNLDAWFIDSVKLCPIFLPRIGGDHDGDQITAKILFSMEANEDARRIINAKTNVLSINGDGICSVGNEGIQTMYTLTRFRTH